MSASTCDNCGTQLSVEARFCRKCGKPQASFVNDAARLEAPTQTLAASESAAATERWRSSPTTPAYLAPQNATPPSPEAAPATQFLQPPGKKSKFSLATLAVIFLLVLISLVAASFLVERVLFRQVIPKRIEKPAAPPMPPAPGRSENASVESPLIYPGAKTTMVVNGKDGDDNVVKLHTVDPPDKVVEWYTAKLKPTNIIRQPSIPTVLSNESVTVVITPQGGGTDILITQGNKR